MQSERVRRKRGRRVQEILETAAELFGERGFDAVSLDDVAEALDVTKGSLYYYFAGKDELATAAIETLGRDWTARLETLLAKTPGTSTERLRALIHAHVTIAVRDYPAALRLFLAPHEWPRAQYERVKALRQRHDRLFRTLVEEGVASGEFRVTSVATVLQCMHAAMSQAPLWRTRPGELADTLMMLVGVGASTLDACPHQTGSSRT
ncbi:TetR/AcrR family transcriptional regulator [Amycolatopsis acidicola]|uniref:TetR/AcrR family transcriptional regulator n=1 Tax=Amycolatopsis acidicola TaxID=2596893 RepID=A0A5N0V0V0_9PSEU|nr:TetR/AcrR family transcriptional regulator [Amycolatopsis acidicola]KAA9159363.1 TetR/AcrR family transcriptional regulator [Amycolatopsis acidicola]